MAKTAEQCQENEQNQKLLQSYTAIGQNREHFISQKYAPKRMPLKQFTLCLFYNIRPEDCRQRNLKFKNLVFFKTCLLYHSESKFIRLQLKHRTYTSKVMMWAKIINGSAKTKRLISQDSSCSQLCLNNSLFFAVL